MRLAARRKGAVVEVVVGAGGVLVGYVDVAVVAQRLGGQQVVRLVAGVAGVPVRVQSDRGRVDAEQQQPQGEGAAHGGAD